MTNPVSPPPGASVAHQGEGRKLHAPSAEKNKHHIADRLVTLPLQSSNALEIASGTGEHVVHFAEHLPHITWQPTDIVEERIESIKAWSKDSSCTNIKSPRFLNVGNVGWSTDFQPQGLVVVINLLHLISDRVLEILFKEVQKTLKPEGFFAIYGPFLRESQHTSPGDKNFDEKIRQTDPNLGYKNDETVTLLARKHGLSLFAKYEMPANNLMFIFQKDL